MREIREISILVEQLNATIGATHAILDGIQKDTTTPYGSTAYKFDFSRKIADIKQITTQILKAKEETAYIPDQSTIENYKETVDKLIELKAISDSLLLNTTLSLDDPMLRSAVQQIYGPVDSIGIDEITDIFRKTKANQTPFVDADSVLNGTINLGYSCAGQDSPCVQASSTSFADGIGQFFKKNIECMATMTFHTMVANILQKVLEFGSLLRNTDPIKKLGYIALLAMVPYIGPQLVGIAMILANDNVYNWIAVKFCTSSKLCGNTMTDDYTNICVNSNIGIDYIYYFDEYEYGGNTIQESHAVSSLALIQDTKPIVNDDLVSFAKNGLYLINDDGEYISATSAICTKVEQYNMFEKTPQIKLDAVMDTGTEELRDPKSYDITMNNTNAVYLIISGEGSHGCVASTQTAGLLLSYKLVDMLMNPKKYNIDNPAALMVSLNNDNIKQSLVALGEMMKVTNDKIGQTNSLLNEPIQKLTSAFGDTYTDTKNAIVEKIADKDKYLEQVESIIATKDSLNPVYNILLDVIKADIDMLQELLKPQTIYQVWCCFISELINWAVLQILKDKAELTIDNIVQYINKYIDSLVAGLEMLKIFIQPNILKFIQSLFNLTGGFLIDLITKAMQAYYLAIMYAVDVFMEKIIPQDTPLASCLPWTILMQWLRNLLQIAIRRLTQLMDVILGKITELRLFNSECAQLGSFLFVVNFYLDILKEIKLNIKEFMTCITIGNNNDTYFDTHPEFNPQPIDGLPGVTSFKSMIDQSFGTITLLKASQMSGMTIYLNKNKLSYLLEKVSKGDQIAIEEYVKGKNTHETFEERSCGTEQIKNIKDIIDYYM